MNLGTASGTICTGHVARLYWCLAPRVVVLAVIFVHMASDQSKLVVPGNRGRFSTAFQCKKFDLINQKNQFDMVAQNGQLNK